MSDTNPSTPAQPDPLLSDEEARLRTALYLKLRLNYQADYYRDRIDEFTFNSDRMLQLSAFIMGVSTVVSSLSILADTVWLPFFTALLPAFAAVISSFRSVYQWERQASMYEESRLGLEQASIVMPDEDYVKPGDYERFFPELVRQSEEVLRGEAAQWGQLINLLPAADGSLYEDRDDAQ
jgi:hypothetical protein